MSDFSASGTSVHGFFFLSFCTDLFTKGGAPVPPHLFLYVTKMYREGITSSVMYCIFSSLPRDSIERRQLFGEKKGLAETS
jgi:hypothetical protein